MGKFIDLTGRKFGKLTVLEYYGKDSRGKNNLWLCECSCSGSILPTVSISNLMSGHTRSCGCLQIERVSTLNKKYNSYDLSGFFGIGYTSKDEEFYFDLEDYDKIKELCWHKDNSSRITCRYKNYTYYMHRLVMTACDNEIIDHINRIPIDNRKKNLRLCTSSQNNMNSNISVFNTSGVIGVSYSNQNKKWFASVYKNRKRIHLGSFDYIEDAITVRLKSEKEFYGEFAPQKHLFETYNI
jgi:hypothetical protein